MVELSSTFQIVESYGDLELEKLDICDDLIEVNFSNRQQGSVAKGPKAYVYSFEVTRYLEKFLGKYDSFLRFSDNCIITKALDDQSDYRFFEKGSGDCLLFTIAHGGVCLREDIYNNYFLD